MKLLENYILLKILFESKHTKTLCYETTIEKIWESKKTAYSNFVITNKITEKEFNRLFNIDKLYGNKYIDKLCQFYFELKNDKSFQGNKTQELNDNFYLFDNYIKNNVPLNHEEKNIYNYKSYNQFKLIIKKYMDYKSNNELEKSENVYYKYDFEVIPIEYREQMCNYGTTNWCVSRKEGLPAWISYIINSCFYIIRNNDRSLLHTIQINKNGSYEILDSNEGQTVLEKGKSVKHSILLKKYHLDKYQFTQIDIKFSNNDMNYIEHDHNLSFYYVEYLIQNNKPVEKRFLNKIAESSEYSYNFAKYLIENNKPIEEIILNKIIEDKYYKKRVFEQLINKFIIYKDILLNNKEHIIKNEDINLKFIIALEKNKIPIDKIFINKLLENDDYTSIYIDYLFKNNKKVDDIFIYNSKKEKFVWDKIKKISVFIKYNKNIPNYLLSLLEPRDYFEVWKKYIEFNKRVPDYIIDISMKNDQQGENSINCIKSMFFKKMPINKIIVKNILERKDSWVCLRFCKILILNKKKINKIFIQKVAQNKGTAEELIVMLFKHKKLPIDDILLNSAKNGLIFNNFLKTNNLTIEDLKQI